ncbi:hypothetical protein HN51_039684, partial [Arachis hypogaea]
MPRKLRYSCISDAGIADKTQHINAQTSGKIDHSVYHDEDYDPEADEVESWDDHVDNLYAEEEAVHCNKPNGRKDTDYWSVVVS